MSMGMEFFFHLVLASGAMLLCLMSLMTSRKHRRRHARFGAVATVMIVLSLAGLAAGMVLAVVSEAGYNPGRALLPMATLLLCMLPLRRARQSKRMRDASERYRRDGPHGREMRSGTSRS
jgi:uncharacterized membrane protein YfcA